MAKHALEDLPFKDSYFEVGVMVKVLRNGLRRTLKGFVWSSTRSYRGWQAELLSGIIQPYFLPAQTLGIGQFPRGRTRSLAWQSSRSFSVASLVRERPWVMIHNFVSPYWYSFEGF
jgi:hypothetical protein